MVTALLSVVVLAAIAGCTQAPTRAPAPEPPPAPPETIEIGRSVEGRRIEGVFFPGEGPCVLILGGIHGNEPSSAVLVAALVDRLLQDPAARGGRRILVIPRMNPDGLEKDTRENASGVDLNRNFETRNFTSGGPHGQRPFSEPEARALAEVLDEYDPSCVVSVHGPLTCVDPDGGRSSEILARAMSAVGGLPVKDLNALPGSFGTYAGVERHITMVTYELASKRLPPEAGDEYLEPHIRALLVAIRKG